MSIRRALPLPQPGDAAPFGPVVAAVVLCPLLVLGAFSLPLNTALQAALPYLVAFACGGGLLLAACLHWIARTIDDDQLDFLGVVYLLAALGVLLRGVVLPQTSAIGNATIIGSTDASALLTLLWHALIPIGALLVLGRHAARYGWAPTLTLGVFTGAVMIAMLPLGGPDLADPNGVKTTLGVTLAVSVGALSALAAILWVRAGNRRPYGPDPWIAANLILVSAGVLLWAIAGPRYSPLWWASQCCDALAFITAGAGQLQAVARFQTAMNNYVASQQVLRRAQPRPSIELSDTSSQTSRDAIAALLTHPDQITMLVQPIVDLTSGRVAGAETLARFTSDPTQPPTAWFDAAHAAGLASDLELLCARAALTHLGALPNDLYLSINLSPSTLAQMHSIADTFTVTGRDWRRIVVEVTEQQLIDDFAHLGDLFTPARDFGVRLAIDDLGSGQAGLQHVLYLRPEVIKIDQSIVQAVDTDPYCRALIASLVAFTSAIGASLVAEGVETAAQHRTLVSLGVSYGQGFRLGRPMRVEDLRVRLQP